MSQEKICQNPECSNIIIKEEWLKNSYGSEWNWQKLRYCCNTCRGRAQYYNKLKKKEQEAEKDASKL